VLEQVKLFLPKLAEANLKLEQEVADGKSVNVEEVKEGEAHIEMNLALGVLEVQKPLNEETMVIPDQVTKETLTDAE
jgi:hypothetical protein